MNKFEELQQRMKKNMTILKACSLSHPDENIDVSGSKEEIIAKTKGIILRTKLLIKNTIPKFNDNAIFRFFKENLAYIESYNAKGCDVLESIEYNYETVYCIFKYFEGYCERIKNKKMDEYDKSIQMLLEKMNNEPLNYPKNSTQEKPFSKYKLSKRQKEVLQLRSDGYNQTETAGKMGIKPTTIRRHEEGLFRKLGTTTIEESIKIAVKNNLIS